VRNLHYLLRISHLTTPSGDDCNVGTCGQLRTARAEPLPRLESVELPLDRYSGADRPLPCRVALEPAEQAGVQPEGAVVVIDLRATHFDLAD
jgi:hypothetical protein